MAKHRGHHDVFCSLELWHVQQTQGNPEDESSEACTGQQQTLQTKSRESRMLAQSVCFLLPCWAWAFFFVFACAGFWQLGAL